jgi:hypothetical protein
MTSFNPIGAHRQAVGVLPRNQLYVGIMDVPASGVHGKRGLRALTSEDLF